MEAHHRQLRDTESAGQPTRPWGAAAAAALALCTLATVKSQGQKAFSLASMGPVPKSLKVPTCTTVCMVAPRLSMQEDFLSWWCLPHTDTTPAASRTSPNIHFNLPPSCKLHLHVAREGAMRGGWSQQRQGAVALPCGVGTDARCLLCSVPDHEREIVSKLYLLNKKMHHWNNISIKNEL